MLATQQLHNNADVFNIFIFFLKKKMFDTSVLLCNYCVRIVQLTYLNVNIAYIKNRYIFLPFVQPSGGVIWFSYSYCFIHIQY